MSDIVLPTPLDWDLLQRQCKAFIESGFLPDHITKNCTEKQAIAKAIAIAWKGRELGIPPMQALAGINVIQGKPTLSAELMLALIFQKVSGAIVNFTTPIEKQDTECTVEMQRPGGKFNVFRFSIEDASRAGLVRSGSGWTKYPAAMLRARAISAGARAVFPDCIMGCYTAEELGGEVIDVGPTLTVAPVPETTRETEVLPLIEKNPKKTTTSGDYARAHPNWENELATEAQQRKLFAIMKSVNIPYNKDFKENLWDEFGIESISELTKGQIQQLYRELEGPPSNPETVEERAARMLDQANEMKRQEAINGKKKSQSEDSTRNHQTSSAEKDS